MFKAGLLFCIDGANLLIVVFLTSHQNDSRLNRISFFWIFGGQGLSIKDFVPISAYEGAGVLKLVDI